MNMMNNQKLYTAVLMTVLTVLAVILVSTVDVQPVGVEGTNIGFAAMNTGFFKNVGESAVFYKISKVCGYICFAAAAGFAVFFFIQLIQRKDLQKVDKNLTALMLLYLATAIVYILFQTLKINYRPILRGKGLEPSFPSSHTMIAIVVMISAIDQWNIYIKKETPRFWAVTLSYLVVMVTVVARLLSGVHWLTDVIGGVLFGFMLLAWYNAVRAAWDKNKR